LESEVAAAAGLVEGQPPGGVVMQQQQQQGRVKDWCRSFFLAILETGSSSYSVGK
jgi:hypothetical protein